MLRRERARPSQAPEQIAPPRPRSPSAAERRLLRTDSSTPGDTCQDMNRVTSRPVGCPKIGPHLQIRVFRERAPDFDTPHGLRSPPSALTHGNPCDATSGYAAGTRAAGIPGSDRLATGIPVRDVCRMNWRPAVDCALTGNRTCWLAGILCENYGSDGTRTRDLRRDRPVLAQPVRRATTLNHRFEQAFRTGSNRL